MILQYFIVTVQCLLGNISYGIISRGKENFSVLVNTEIAIFHIYLIVLVFVFFLLQNGSSGGCDFIFMLIGYQIHFFFSQEERKSSSSECFVIWKFYSMFYKLFVRNKVTHQTNVVCPLMYLNLAFWWTVSRKCKSNQHVALCVCVGWFKCMRMDHQKAV